MNRSNLKMAALLIVVVAALLYKFALTWTPFWLDLCVIALGILVLLFILWPKENPLPMGIDTSLPRIGCDFNARGLSDEVGDPCYYSFSRQDADLVKSMRGQRVILYSYDSDSEVTACEATIEPHIEGWLGGKQGSVWLCGARARPTEKTWYQGPVPWDKSQ